MYRASFLILLTLLFQNVTAQKRNSRNSEDNQEYKIIRHEVELGETVKMISQKFLSPPAEIYRLNKFAVDGISQGMILLVPIPVKDAPEEAAVNETQNQQTAAETPPAAPETEKKQEIASGKLSNNGEAISHTVASGETLSGLAQQYGVSQDDIKSANPKIAQRGLRMGDVVSIPAAGGIIPSNDEASATAESSSDAIEHTVVSGETLSGLAEKYHVSIAEIKRQNKKLQTRGLQIGQVIKIKKE
jgi:LysM repeat protein